MRRNYTFTFLLLLVAQLFTTNYLRLGPYVSLSLLPAMTLCLPVKIRPVGSMLIAAAAALAVDLLADGLPCLNVAAILPAALIRKRLIDFIFGEELSTRNEVFTLHKNSLEKIIIALAAMYAVYLAMYIILDGAAFLPFFRNVSRFFLSLGLSVPAGILVVGILNPDDRR